MASAVFAQRRFPYFQLAQFVGALLATQTQRREDAARCFFVFNLYQVQLLPSVVGVARARALTHDNRHFKNAAERLHAGA